MFIRSALLNFDKFMRDGLGWKKPTRAYVLYYIDQIWEQVLAVVPITMCLVVSLGVYFQKQVDRPGVLAGGLVSAMVGLMLFVDGLRVAIMPLGSMLGQRLPTQFKVRWILLISCAIGILCTYAEPAIASLRPLASLVKRCQTPYLFFILNDYQEILVLSIGLGVGVAAMVGVLRFLRDWSLKPLIAASLSPTIACACYMKWGNPELAPLIGLAWDCGAVTTGPVTVPILLAIGIGVIKGKKAREAALLQVEQQASKNQGQALEGFGIITLASTFPVLAVELLSIVVSLMYTPGDIRTNFGKIDCSTYTEEVQVTQANDSQILLDCVVFAARSILPLNIFMILLILFVLRRELPDVSYEPPHVAGLLEDDHNYEDPSVFEEYDDPSGCDERGTLPSWNEEHNRLSSHSFIKRHSARSPTNTAAAKSDQQVWPIEEAVESASAGNCKFATHELACSATHGRVTPTRTPSDTPAVSFASGAVRGRGGGILKGEAVGGWSGIPLRGGVLSIRRKRSHAKGSEFSRGGGIKRTNSNAAESEGWGIKRTTSYTTSHHAPDDGRQSIEIVRELADREKQRRLADIRNAINTVVWDDLGEEEGKHLHEKKKRRERTSSMEIERHYHNTLPEASETGFSTRAGAGAHSWKTMLRKQLPLIGGIVESFVGMILFNIGLVYGFTALGDQSGLLLPAAFLEMPDIGPKSPYYGYGEGVLIVLSVVFALGFLATRAEPALRVMGKTVEALSEGQFTESALVYTVCVGVGTGLVIGSSKILFEVNIIYLILVKYAIASALTVFSSENFTNIAWDSAGVTTGPVTVPFVLSMGIGFGRAKRAQEGFGILTCASVAPIITVLASDMLRRLIQSAIRSQKMRQLARMRHSECQTDDLEALLPPASAPASPRPDTRVRGTVLRCSKRCDLRELVCVEEQGVQCDLSHLPPSSFRSAADPLGSSQGRSLARQRPDREAEGDASSRRSSAAYELLSSSKLALEIAQPQPQGGAGGGGVGGGNTGGEFTAFKSYSRDSARHANA